MLLGVLMVLLAVLWHRQAEGVFRASVRGFGLVQVGRVQVGVWAYRPNRAYFRVQVA